MTATVGEWWMWAIFFAIVTLALTLDFIILKGRKSHKVSIKEALTWTTVWVFLALCFNGLLWWHLTYQLNHPLALQKTIEFLTGYILEKSLSIDNIFVFLMIFQYFKIPPEYQRRVLLYGVLGAIAMRFVIILFGIYLVNKFHWILYLFGIFLTITGVKLLLSSDDKSEISDNLILKWMRRILRVTHTLHNEKFVVIKNKLVYVTPLFLTLVLIEISDLIFAVDSIPAVFAVTNDSFIVFTSNIFAILGLRALYFLFSYMADRFYLLKHAVAIILTFVGLKMLVAYWVAIPVGITLGFIVLTLAVFTIASIYKGKGRKNKNPTPPF